MRPPSKRPEGRKPARPSGPPAQRTSAPRPDRGGDEPSRKPARGRPEREIEEPRKAPRGRAERIGEASRKPAARSERGGDAPQKPARGRAERFGDDARKPARQRLDRNAEAPARPSHGRPDRRGEEPRGFKRGEEPRGGMRGEAPRGASRAEDPRRSGRGRPEPVVAAPPLEAVPEPPRPGAGAGSGAYWIYGHHAVLAALSNPRRKPRRLLTTTDAEIALRDEYDGPWRVTPERADRARFHTFLTEDAVHQGIALLAEPLESVLLEDAIEISDGPVLLLDQVTDPRNVGAALRAAAAFGAAAVVLQDRHAPHETGTLARAASGSLDIVPVVREVNLSRAIAALQKAGFWVLGLAGDGKRTIAEAAPRDRRVALVLGGEEAGLRRLQRETCDELVRLPMAEGVESLNVSTAAAVALYEIVRK